MASIQNPLNNCGTVVKQNFFFFTEKVINVYHLLLFHYVSTSPYSQLQHSAITLHYISLLVKFRFVGSSNCKIMETGTSGFIWNINSKIWFLLSEKYYKFTSLSRWFLQERMMNSLGQWAETKVATLPRKRPLFARCTMLANRMICPIQKDPNIWYFNLIHSTLLFERYIYWVYILCFMSGCVHEYCIMKTTSPLNW